MPSDSAQPPSRRSAHAVGRRGVEPLPQPPARRGYRRALWVLGLIATLALLRLVLRELFVNHPQFALREIVVHSQGPLSPKQLVDASTLSEGMNLLTVDLREVQQRLEALPQVRRAEVTRDYQGRLSLRVQQRSAVARLRVAAADPSNPLMVLDDEAIAFPQNPTAALRLLPEVVHGEAQSNAAGAVADRETLKLALDWVGHCAQLRQQGGLPALRELHLEKPWRLRLLLDEGLTLWVDGADTQGQRTRLAGIWAEAKRRGWRIASLDLSVKSNTPVKFHEPKSAADEVPVARPVGP